MINLSFQYSGNSYFILWYKVLNSQNKYTDLSLYYDALQNGSFQCEYKLFLTFLCLEHTKTLQDENLNFHFEYIYIPKVLVISKLTANIL